MSVVIKRDGLNISISTHEEREPQILSKIKKAGVLRETASDDGTVHDERVADTTRIVSLNITDIASEVKLELDEINKAALRWTVNDDGTLTPEDKPSTGNLQNNITDTAPEVKSVFEIAAGSVFDRVRR